MTRAIRSLWPGCPTMHWMPTWPGSSVQGTRWPSATRWRTQSSHGGWSRGRSPALSRLAQLSSLPCSTSPATTSWRLWWQRMADQTEMAGWQGWPFWTSLQVSFSRRLWLLSGLLRRWPSSGRLSAYLPFPCSGRAAGSRFWRRLPSLRRPQPLPCRIASARTGR